MFDRAWETHSKDYREIKYGKENPRAEEPNTNKDTRNMSKKERFQSKCQHKYVAQGICIVCDKKAK